MPGERQGASSGILMEEEALLSGTLGHCNDLDTAVLTAELHRPLQRGCCVRQGCSGGSTLLYPTFRMTFLGELSQTPRSHLFRHPRLPPRGALESGSLAPVGLLFTAKSKWGRHVVAGLGCSQGKSAVPWFHSDMP